MPSAPLPANESDRLAALRSFAILDTPPEPSFDELARIAAGICGTPMAAVTFVDESRQWFKARIGLASIESPRAGGFCAYTILNDGMLIVPDATLDARFAENHDVAGEPFIRFYAGAPLRVAGGLRLGSLCVIDRRPRVLSETQLTAVAALSRQAAALIEARRGGRELSGAPPQVRTPEGFIAICAYCGKVRVESDRWQQIEGGLDERAASQLTHGICPSCAASYFPDEVADLLARQKEPNG